jgi:uncharacterized repeat protein (TIGR03847 family)
MATIQVYNLNPVYYASAGCIGEPGEREFFIQGSKDGIIACVSLEKQQLEHISIDAMEFLNLIGKEFGEEEMASPEDFDLAEMVLPVPALFRVRSTSILFDEHSSLVTLILRKSEIDTVIDFDESKTDSDYSVIEDSLVEDMVLRLTMTRQQLRALAVQGQSSISKGRETCQFCFLPKDLSGHLCPRMN